MKTRMTVTRILAICAAVCLLCATASAQVPGKKLIEYGWDTPRPTFVEKNIREMEKRPFEGVIMRIGEIANAFSNEKFSEEKMAAELAAAGRIEWNKFTDNFLIMNSRSTMDWFSDADWEAVLHNIGLNAKIAKAARCKGLCWDAEPYGFDPWLYTKQAHAQDKTFEEYEAQVRTRGGQFTDKIEEYFDAPVIHTLFQLVYFGSIAAEPDVAKRNAVFAKHHYGLLPAFVNGMLDAADPGTIITDGNEGSYYYTKASQYSDAYETIREKVLPLIAPENRDKYRKQVQCAHALYVDHLFSLRTSKNVSAWMTPEERAQWFEHNVYHALKTSDCYVWLYSEKMSWWKNRDIPPGLPEAVRAAKQKLAGGQPLGFDMTDIIARAKQRQDQELRSKLTIRTAQVPRVNQADGPPTIDGQLGDAVWKSVSALEAFIPYVLAKEGAVTARTLAWITYDDKHLYLAVWCDEPKMSALSVVGAQRDQDVWLGDSVDVFVSAGPARLPYYHIIVNPNNVRWDAHCKDDSDLSWSPKYQSATFQGSNYWTLELAIPWAAMKTQAPKPGAKLFGNICRQRCPIREYSAWSQCIRGFVEPDQFGAWLFE